MKNILPVFSFLFHPIFIPIVGTLFYVFYGQNYLAKEHFILLLFQVVIITFLLPLTFFFLLKTVGKVDTIMLSDLSQRKIPILLQLVLTTVLLTKSVTVDRFQELFFFFLGSQISLIITFAFLYLKVKASIHMISISAFTFFVIGISFHNQLNLLYLIAFLFLINGFVASSRLYMKAHVLNELIIGFLIGVLPQIGLFYFWL